MVARENKRKMKRKGEKMKNEEKGGKNEKGERKTEENYLKTGIKALKMLFFLGYKLQKCTPLPKLIVDE